MNWEEGHAGEKGASPGVGAGGPNLQRRGPLSLGVCGLWTSAQVGLDGAPGPCLTCRWRAWARARAGTSTWTTSRQQPQLLLGQRWGWAVVGYPPLQPGTGKPRPAHMATASSARPQPQGTAPTDDGTETDSPRRR